MSEEEKRTALQKTEEELRRCEACPLRRDCLAPVGGFGAADTPLVLVGEGPGGVEDDYGCPLIGPSAHSALSNNWPEGPMRGPP